jgi:tetratricopeptide (TPR) repeat protein
VEEALRLDSNSDEALAARAIINFRYKYNWTDAETDFKQAIQLNPHNILARHWYGELLHYAGRFDEGLAQQNFAMALQPHSVRILDKTAQGYYFARRYDEAISYAKDALFIEKENPTLLYNISEIYEQKGDYKEAVDAWKQAMILEEANPKWIAILENSAQKNGHRGFVQAKTDWLESLIESNYIYPTDLAKGYAALGEKDKAIEWLNKGIEARVPDILSIGRSPAFDSIRSDSRFQGLLKQLNSPR